jgi:hypothetical protein
MKMKFLDDSIDFNIIDNKILVWSHNRIFHADILIVNSSTGVIEVKQSTFEILPTSQTQEDAKIVSVSSMG